MAANPNPAHITAGMWWFIEEWERMVPATVFAGAWGRAKPGYHCDAYGLWWHKDGNGNYDWRDDYSLELGDDQVLGTPLEQYGAGVDITFPDAQGGNYTQIRMYSDRVKAAWKGYDPRLKGWREVLCNCTDSDSAADGFDIPGHYERTPDASHKWHIHFSCLRRYLDDMTVWQAMISILRGETLAQWQAGGGGDDQVRLFKYNGDYWISRADGTMGRETVTDLLSATPPGDPGAEYSKLVLVYGACVVPDKDGNGWPATDLKSKGFNDAMVDKAFGRRVPYGSGAGPHPSTGGGGGLTVVEVEDIADDRARAVVSATALTPPPAV